MRVADNLCLGWFGIILIFKNLLQFLTSDVKTDAISQSSIPKTFKKVFV